MVRNKTHNNNGNDNLKANVNKVSKNNRVKLYEFSFSGGFIPKIHSGNKPPEGKFVLHKFSFSDLKRI